MRRFAILAAALLSVTIVAGCSSPRPLFSYRYDATRDFLGPAAHVHVLAADRLHPALASVAHDTDAVVQAAAAHLAGAGVEVQADDALATAWQRSMATRGYGFFDPDTGEFDQQAWQRQLAHACTDLATGGRCDGVVLVGVVSRIARSSGTAAAWDGVRRRLPVLNRPSDLENWQFNGAVAGASLMVWVFDAQGRDVMLNLGGLDLLERFEWVSSTRYEVRARDLDLTRAELLTEALCVAMQPLIPCTVD